jgi:hypothetical protein
LGEGVVSDWFSGKLHERVALVKLLDPQLRVLDELVARPHRAASELGGLREVGLLASPPKGLLRLTEELCGFLDSKNLDWQRRNLPKED